MNAHNPNESMIATASAPAAPWGAPAPSAAVRLADIMNEEASLPTPPMPTPAPVMWTCGICTYAENTSQLSCGVCETPRSAAEVTATATTPAPTPAVTGAEAEDDDGWEVVPAELLAADGEGKAPEQEEPRSEITGDLALALSLQREELERSRTATESGSSKVRVVNGIESALLQADDYDRAELFEEEEQDREDAAAEARAQAEADEELLGAWNSGGGQGFNTGINVRSHRVRAALYRNENGDLVSKHDATLNGRHNARQLGGLVPDDTIISGRVYSEVKRADARANKKGISRGRVEGSAFSTQGGVLDERTRLLLHKLVNAEVLEDMGGTLRSGKEAHVYHGVSPGGENVAVKIFRTTTNGFANRADYVSGDGRFDSRDFNRSNSRQKINTWAEKEARNMQRLTNRGINVPRFIARKENVLVMSFVGTDGVPAPQLREVTLSRRGWASAYVQVQEAMRGMYARANIVHGDLSEYNLLYHDHRVVVIDLGQAIEKHAPQALDLLLRDCTVITRFFEDKGLGDVLLTPEELMAMVVAEQARSSSLPLAVEESVAEEES